MCAYDLKYGTLEIPGIGDGEPIFIIRARDALAVGVLDEYIYFADEAGLSEITDGVQLAKEQFESWQKKNGTRLPS